MPTNEEVGEIIEKYSPPTNAEIISMIDEQIRSLLANRAGRTNDPYYRPPPWRLPTQGRQMMEGVAEIYRENPEMGLQAARRVYEQRAAELLAASAREEFGIDDVPGS